MAYPGLEPARDQMEPLGLARQLLLPVGCTAGFVEPLRVGVEEVAGRPVVVEVVAEVVGKPGRVAGKRPVPVVEVVDRPAGQKMAGLLDPVVEEVAGKPDGVLAEEEVGKSVAVAVAAEEVVEEVGRKVPVAGMPVWIEEPERRWAVEPNRILGRPAEVAEEEGLGCKMEPKEPLCTG